jgi:cobalt transporter subunit CbtB
MQHHPDLAVAARGASASTSIAKPLQIAAALLLGTVILFGAAFAQTSAVHNAAHDMRHSQGFPCH